MKRRIYTRPYKCSVCKGDGHNKKGCPLGKEQYWIEVKGEGSHGAIPNKCSLCMKSGHNKSGCPLEKKMVPVVNPQPPPGEMQIVVHAGRDNVSHNAAFAEIGSSSPPQQAETMLSPTLSNLEGNQQQPLQHPKVRKSARIQWNKWIAPKKIDTSIIDLTED